MKRTYHLCLSAGKEIMFRTDSDYIHGINCLCIATHRTGSSLLAYSFMSNHVHICIRSEKPSSVIKQFRYMYTRYFNAKYHRTGRLGERSYFELELDGLYHILTAIAYVLRNPLHHGVSATPFGYSYSSVSAVFAKELGHTAETELIDAKSQYQYLPGKVSIPVGFKMNSCGMIIPESTIAVKDVEFCFATARSYIYYLNRLSGEKWEKEQLRDENGIDPITLDKIERGVSDVNIGEILANEHGKANYNTMTDIKLCEIVDKYVKERYDCPSIYCMRTSALSCLAEELVRTYHLPRHQVSRSLALTRHR